MITTWRSLTPSRLHDVAILLATAFDEPATRWLVPDPVRRQTVMPGFFTHMITDALDGGGSVDILADDGKPPLAASIWFDNTREAARDTVDDDTGRWRDVFGPDNVARWLALEALMDAHHVAGPHAYLFAIGVHPALRGQGLGSLLLDHSHAQRPGPYYLEATSPASRRLYTRKGYLDLGELAVPDGPCLRRMLRPATCSLDPDDGARAPTPGDDDTTISVADTDAVDLTGPEPTSPALRRRA
jgi:GNAT superfamily N-acetyltransferase